MGQLLNRLSRYIRSYLINASECTSKWYRSGFTRALLKTSSNNSWSWRSKKTMMKNGIIGRKNMSFEEIKCQVYFKKMLMSFLWLENISTLLKFAWGFNSILYINKLRETSISILKIRTLLRALWGPMTGQMKDCKI